MHTHEADDQLLGMLHQLGVDLAKPREIIFYFVFATESDAEKASRKLAQEKFDCEKFKSDLPWWKRLFVKPQWNVAVTRNMALDESEIKGLTTAFQRIAAKFNGQYDGWEANVMDDHIDAAQLENLGN